MSRPSARRGVALFLLLVVAASGVVETVIAKSGPTIHSAGLWVLLLMWIPGLAAVLVRLVRREGFGDVSFRFGAGCGRWTLTVIAYPIVVGAVAYGLAWVTGLAEFAPPSSTFGQHPSSDAGRFFLRLGAALLPGVPLSLISAFGEELGWRGYFVPRLVEAGVPQPLLLSGLVWGVWHVPLILTGQYAVGPHPLLSSVVFLVSILPAAYLFGAARLATGSVWPAAVAHAAWNSVIQGVFDASTRGSSSARATNIWVGESGLLVALVSAIAAGSVLALTRASWEPTAARHRTELGAR